MNIPAGERRILTIPNLLSAVRIAMIPVFVIWLLEPETRFRGMFLLGAVVSTDWVDGFIARRYNQVTLLGKILDPIADRLAIAAALITFIATDLIPLWAALIILVRDAVVMVAGLYLGAAKRIRIDVRPIGKVATFTLWWGIALVAWGNAGFALPDAALVLGWTWFVVGTIEYYAATVVYAKDVRRALGIPEEAPRVS